MTENIVDAVKRSKSFQPATLAPATEFTDGYLFTTHNRFVGIVKLDYSVLTVRSCPSAHQAARHAFSRSVFTGKLGASAVDLAGHVLFVPSPPWGGPVMVK